MRRDGFKLEASFQKMLKPQDRTLRGVPSPEDLAAFRNKKPTRKIPKLNGQLALPEDRTSPDYSYSPGSSYFESLAAGCELQAGIGAAIYDPEATITQAA